MDVDASGTARSTMNRFGQIHYLSPLQAAVDTGLEDIVKVLLVKGADPNDGPGKDQDYTSIPSAGKN